jgi:small nuclear ribonucleoprotein (snRNP)-like protein
VKKLLRQHLRHNVLLTLKTGESFRGVLFAADSEAVVLRNCEAVGVGENRTNVTVDGELLLLRPDIAFMQFA